MTGWNCNPEVRKNVQMTLSFVTSVAEAIGRLEHMFQAGGGWVAELMTCTERCWPFGVGDKLNILVSKHDRWYKVRIEGEYGQFWNPDDENQDAFLQILSPKINDPANRFLLPSRKQLFLQTLGRAVDGLTEGDKDMLRRILPRLYDASWEFNELYEELLAVVKTRIETKGGNDEP